MLSVLGSPSVACILARSANMERAVPVAIKLSRKFYERFGDEIVTELVELLNQVDATYKSELHQFIDVHFARFDAKLEQRVGELRAEFRAEMDKRFAELRVEMNDRFARLEAKLETMATRELLEKGLREQTGLFFAAWGIQLAALIALWFR